MSKNRNPPPESDHNHKVGKRHSNVGKLRSSHRVLDDSGDAARACGVLLARRDDEAAPFEREQERGHSCGQVIVAHCGLRPLLRGALVSVATVGDGDDGDDSEGDNGSSGGSDARGRITEAG